MNKIKALWGAIQEGILGLKMNFFVIRRDRFGYIAPSAIVQAPFWGNKKNIFLYERTEIGTGCRVASLHNKFIVKRNSVIAMGVTVITGNHVYNRVGVGFKDLLHERKDRQDVIVEEDVWIGANVTLLPRATIGRGAVIGAGSVIRLSIPPYAVVVGNPAKVVKFRFSPEEIVEHEKKLYPENERLPLALLEKNYKEYFLDKGNEIRNYLKL